MKDFAKLGFVALTLAIAAEPADPGPLERLGPDAFRFVAGEVVRSSPPVQREFASVVLMQLAEVYFGEAGLARRQAESDISADPLGSRLGNWALDVEREAQHYLVLHDAVHSGALVRVFPLPGPDSHVMLVIGAQAVLPGHPRPSQQAHLEASIIGDFCRRVDCLAIAGDR